MAQQETLGPPAARPEVRGPRVARPRAPGPRVAQQGSPEAVPVRLNHRVSRKQRLQLGVRRRSAGGGVGEIRLVKDDVSGDQDAARGEIKALVPLMVRGVTKEHTASQAGRKLVRSSDGGVKVTRTSEDPKVVVARRGTEKSVVWSGSRRSLLLCARSSRLRSLALGLCTSWM